jgi:hypothetical protein
LLSLGALKVPKEAEGELLICEVMVAPPPYAAYGGVFVNRAGIAGHDAHRAP